MEGVCYCCTPAHSVCQQYKLGPNDDIKKKAKKGKKGKGGKKGKVRCIELLFTCMGGC